MELLNVIPLIILLVWAAITDVATRRIPNWLTFSLLLAGLVNASMGTAPVTLLDSFGGAGVGVGLSLFGFIIGAMGGGDLKLFAAVGAWVGTKRSVEVFAAAEVAAMLIVLIQAGWQGKLKQLARNSAVLAVNIAHVKDLGVEHVQSVGTTTRSIGKPLQFAVPILIATLVILVGRL